MDANDYITAWLVYLGAALVLSVLGWRLLRRLRPRELGWLLQCWLLALLFTPWYVLEDQDILAPALIVFALDTITIAPVAGIRALTPLVLALLAGLLLAALLGVVYRIRRHGGPQPAAVVEAPSIADPLPAVPAMSAPKPRAPRRRKTVAQEGPPLSTAEPGAVTASAPEKPRRKPAAKVPPADDGPQS